MKIFLSYSRRDKPFVEQVASDLGKILSNSKAHPDANIWFDRELTGGHQWWNAILNVIEDCDLFVFILSSSSLASVPCQLERRYAHGLNKRILPIQIDDSVDLSLMPPELQMIQCINYIERSIESYQKLQDAIFNLPTPLSPPNIKPERPPAPLSNLGSIKELLQSKNLERDKQEEIYEVLVEHLSIDAERQKALLLLKEFKNHPDTRKAIIRDIDMILAANLAQPVTTVLKDGFEKSKETFKYFQPLQTPMRKVWRFVRRLPPILQFFTFIAFALIAIYSTYAVIALGSLVLICGGPIVVMVLLWRFSNSR